VSELSAEANGSLSWNFYPPANQLKRRVQIRAESLSAPVQHSSRPPPLALGMSVFFAGFVFAR
jgi:hypothetical protein